MANWHLNAGVAVCVVLGVGAALVMADWLSGRAPSGDKTANIAIATKASGEAAKQASAKPQDIAQDPAPQPSQQESSQFVQVAELGVGTSQAGPKPRYLTARWSTIHFKPDLDEATNEQCLSCHQEIITHKVREVTPAGLETSQTLAWYQTLDTYAGEQSTFHQRHLTSPFAKQMMNLKCNFCHQGNDPREEAHGSSATTMAPGDFKLRKMVNPEKSCLMCHGTFPAESMGLEGRWSDVRADFEDEETKNGCMLCHEEQFRTVRHQVNYLNADAIEAAAKQGSSDVCFGCHGGRSWYRISYPYPRHPWPDMPEEMPEWAKDRPTQSDPKHRITAK